MNKFTKLNIKDLPKEGDVMITPANLKHKIEAGGTEENEYYFIRVKAK